MNDASLDVSRTRAGTAEMVTYPVVADVGRREVHALQRQRIRPHGHRPRETGCLMAMVPFNRPHITGREFDYIREAIDRGASVERRAVLAALRRVAGADGRMPPGAADAFLHGCARDGGAARRHSAWRRSHHAVVHVRLDRQRVRASRRRARLRGHQARHAQYRRASDRGGASRSARARSCPCTTQGSPARWTPSWRSRVHTPCP